MATNNLGERIFQVVGRSRDTGKCDIVVCAEFYLEIDLKPENRPLVLVAALNALRLRTRSKRVKMFNVYHNEMVLDVGMPTY